MRRREKLPRAAHTVSFTLCYCQHEVFLCLTFSCEHDENTLKTKLKSEALADPRNLLEAPGGRV